MLACSLPFSSSSIPRFCADPIDFLSIFPQLRDVSASCNIDYVTSSIMDYATDITYDEVWSCNVIAHVEDTDAYCKSLLSFCKPGTILRIAEPDNTPFQGHPAIVNTETFNILRKSCKNIIKDTMLVPNGLNFVNFNHTILILEF